MQQTVNLLVVGSIPTLGATNMQDPKLYEVRIRLLGNEIFAISLASSNDSNRWIALGLITVFSVLTILGAYGDKLVQLYKWLIN